MAKSSRDYYSILGVAKGASIDDIKIAFKKLARQFHPDKFRTEAEKNQATAQFQEIQEAYDVLRDDSKRRQYDALGHDAFKNGGAGFGQGSQGFEGFDFSGSGFENIFNDFFSGFSGGAGFSERQVFKGEDLRFSLELSLEEAFTGFETSIKIPRKVGCSTCFSSGNDSSSAPSQCRKCNGSGKVYVNQFVFRVQQSCDDCSGTGKAYKKCSSCYGEGRKNESSTIKIKVPKGVEHGMKLHLKGEGNAVKGGVNGDLFILISIKKHHIFTVEKANLILTVPISVFDAVLGIDLQIPTLEKEPCALKVPAGTQSGAQLLLRGKGMRKFNSEYRGDILVNIEVEIPKDLTASEKSSWETLQKEYKNTARSKSFWDTLKSYWR